MNHKHHSKRTASLLFMFVGLTLAASAQFVTHGTASDWTNGKTGIGSGFAATPTLLGQLTLYSGTAATTAPNISFQNSIGATAGSIFWINPLNASLQIGGVGTSAPSMGALNIDKTGNVGVGNVIADAMANSIFNVKATGSRVASFYNADGSTNSRLSFVSSSDDYSKMYLYYYDEVNKVMQTMILGNARTAGAKTLALDGTNGFVGIGTYTPAAQLCIYNETANVPATFSLQNKGASADNSKFWITSQANQLQIGGQGSAVPTAGAINIDATGSVSTPGTLSSSASLRAAYASSTSYINMGKYGSALAGNSNPYVINSASGDATSDLIVYGSGTTNYLNLRLYDGDLKLGSNTTPNAQVTNAGDASFKSVSITPASGTPALLTSADGRTYINTSTLLTTTQIAADPNARLMVKGNIYAEGVKVKLQSEWPDFVFAPGYKHLTIAELDNYIKENSRLPGLPSAQEVSQKGVDVAQMQAATMQKIEELSLYIIELQKQNQEQARRNQEQDKLIQELLNRK